MKLLLDENLSHRLVALLADTYPGSAHVRDLGLVGRPDVEIWSRAAEDGYVIVSKESDFFQRAVLFGAPPKVVWVRIGNGPSSVVLTMLREHDALVAAFAQDAASAWLQLPA